MTKKRKLALPKPVVRNGMARHPLLGKSAVHEKTGKAKRRAMRVRIGKMDLEETAVQAAVSQSFNLLSRGAF
ncbi:MAG: hypothetical protein V3U76_11540 [Granulosicoccus sp.]